MGRIVNNTQRASIGLNDDDFLCDICLGRYVLILGDDVILKEEYGSGNSADYIYEECRKGLSQAEIYELGRGGANMKTLICKMLCNDWEYSLDEISEPLVELIKTKCFPLVLTTTFDGYVEKLMHEVYGESLNVVNISDNKSAIQCKEEYDILVPTLFYVFGKAEKNLDFAFTEDDHIRILCKWLDTNTKPNKLIEYLRSKKLLIIGGKYENWYFRFFWFSLRQSLNAGQREGDVVISLENDNENRLSSFLDRNAITNHQESSRVFLKELSNSISNPDEKLLSSIHAANFRNIGGVFISYAHEDYPIACQIYGFLLSWGIPVWFDNAKLKDYSNDQSNYDKRIANAISQCKVFLPILSGQVKRDLTNNEDRYYKNTEWNLALNNKKCITFPIALYGFDVRKDANLLPDNLFAGKNIFNWAIDGADGLYNTLLSIFKQ